MVDSIETIWWQHATKAMLCREKQSSRDRQTGAHYTDIPVGMLEIFTFFPTDIRVPGGIPHLCGRRPSRYLGRLRRGRNGRYHAIPRLRRKRPGSRRTIPLAALTLGLILFIGLHLLRETGLRIPLRERLGARTYLLLFCLGILLSIVLIVHGKSTSSFTQLWVPPWQWRTLTNMLMLTSCIFIAAGNLPQSYLRETLTHPMLLGVVIWGASHLLSNGDLASVLLFGGLALWALVKVVTLQLTATGNSAELSSRHKPSLYWDAAAVAVGTIAYGAFLLFHGPLFGFALIPAA